MQRALLIEFDVANRAILAQLACVHTIIIHSINMHNRCNCCVPFIFREWNVVSDSSRVCFSIACRGHLQPVYTTIFICCHLTLSTANSHKNGVPFVSSITTC